MAIPFTAGMDLLRAAMEAAKEDGRFLAVCDAIKEDLRKGIPATWPPQKNATPVKRVR